MNPRRWLYKHAFWFYKLADDYPLNLEIDKTVDEIETLLASINQKPSKEIKQE